MDKYRKPIIGLIVSAVALIGIAKFEGYRGEAYKDVVGIPTIGFGETKATGGFCPCRCGDHSADYHTTEGDYRRRRQDCRVALRIYRGRREPSHREGQGTCEELKN